MRKAVITGDIFHSTRLSAEYRQSLLMDIDQAVRIWDKDFKMKSEVFRGDSFQCLIDVKYALRVGLIIKTYIRSLNPSSLYDVQNPKRIEKKASMFYTNFIIDARIGIGIGEIEVVAKKMSASQGEAFTLSGRLLDTIKNTKQRLAITSNDQFNNELQTESVLLDAILNKTSALQCTVLNLKLLGYTEIEIAIELGIAQSAVNQRSTSGNWNAIQVMLDRFEKIYYNE